VGQHCKGDPEVGIGYFPVQKCEIPDFKVVYAIFEEPRGSVGQARHLSAQQAICTTVGIGDVPILSEMADSYAFLQVPFDTIKHRVQAYMHQNCEW
jgi:hypothetical protein